jgi:hypothetical protein
MFTSVSVLIELTARMLEVVYIFHWVYKDDITEREAPTLTLDIVDTFPPINASWETWRELCKIVSYPTLRAPVVEIELRKKAAWRTVSCP